MKTFLLFIFIASGIGQTCIAQHPRLIYPGYDTDHSDSLTIRHVRPQTLGKSLVVKYQNGTKMKIPKASLWGFSDKKGRIFRFYNNHPYRAIIKDNFVKYVYQQCRYTYTRYSKTLDSDVVKWKRQL
jgi:hypothetical protein